MSLPIRVPGDRYSDQFYAAFKFVTALRPGTIAVTPAGIVGYRISESDWLLSELGRLYYPAVPSPMMFFHPKDESLVPRITRWLNINQSKRFRRGAFFAIEFANLHFFEQPTPLPAVDETLPERERSRRFEALLKKIVPGDVLLTVNIQSLMSRFIAWVDHGVWSHGAIYLGDGDIGEMLTSGYRIGSVRVYDAPQYRVGLYRHAHGIDPAKYPLLREAAMRYQRSGPLYGHFNAGVAGLIAILNLGAFVKCNTPNAFALNGCLYLVAAT